MNSKNIAKHLKAKIDDWLLSINSEEIKKNIRDNVIVTGGAIVSLLNSEEPHDYDIYFKTKEAVLAVAKYYAKEFSKDETEYKVSIIAEENGRISCFIEDKAGFTGENEKEDVRLPIAESETKKDKRKYKAKFFTTNAISLSDKIQLVIRFYGDVEQIHENYDFVHCTCSYDYATGKVNLPSKALECIINKELQYVGSKYPLCSIIRTRKFISRGYHINAGQYLKIAWQLNELDLTDHNVLKDQLAGVDSAYFDDVISALKMNNNEKIETSVFFDIINKIFG